MIVKVIESLKLKPNDALVIVYNPAFLDRRVWVPLKSAYPALTLVELGGPTRGAAETVLIGLKGLPRKLLERPVMLVDGDCFYDEDILSMYRAVCLDANAVFYFKDTQVILISYISLCGHHLVANPLNSLSITAFAQPKPMYSYIKTEPDGKITEVKEKVKISDNANSGCYCFAKGEELQKQVRFMVQPLPYLTFDEAHHALQ